MPTLNDIHAEMQRLMEQAERERLALRLIGGLAVRVHSSHIEKPGFQREYPDIDFVASRNDYRRLANFFTQMGYSPDKAFNTLNGDRRQIYYDSQSGRHIDIFIGDFQMTATHKIKKTQLRKEGYDLETARDNLYVLLPGGDAYVPVDDALYRKIMGGKYSF